MLILVICAVQMCLGILLIIISAMSEMAEDKVQRLSRLVGGLCMCAAATCGTIGQVVSEARIMQVIFDIVAVVAVTISITKTTKSAK